MKRISIWMGLPLFLGISNLMGCAPVHLGQGLVPVRENPHLVGNEAAIIATVKLESLPIAVAVNPKGNRVYVADDSGTISVFDTATNNVASTLKAGEGPRQIAISKDGSVVYVASVTSNTVSVIDATTSAIIRVIDVGPNPASVVLTPDGSRLYVSNAGSDSVTVINTATWKAIASIKVGPQPGWSALTPNGKTLYVPIGGSDKVSAVDTLSNTVRASVTTGLAPTSVAITPDGVKAYVTNRDHNTVSVIDITTNSLAAIISVGWTPCGIAITPDGTKALVVHMGLPERPDVHVGIVGRPMPRWRLRPHVSVIDTSSNTEIAATYLAWNPCSIAITPDGTRAYVTSAQSRTAYVINPLSAGHARYFAPHSPVGRQTFMNTFGEIPRNARSLR